MLAHSGSWCGYAVAYRLWLRPGGYGYGVCGVTPRGYGYAVGTDSGWYRLCVKRQGVHYVRVWVPTAYAVCVRRYAGLCGGW